VVVDTEEEFDWSKPFSRDNTSVNTIAAQKRLHSEVYDTFGVVPTYAVDWPVATNSDSVHQLKLLQDAGQCEIGAHLHPWVNPPHTEEVGVYNSFPGNLSYELEHQKLLLLTKEIFQNFGRPPILYKAGRYGIGQHTSRILHELGYLVDASVVPHTSFAKGFGPDFTHLPDEPYWFGKDDHKILELPVTTGFCGALNKYGRRLYPSLLNSVSVSLRLPGISSKLHILDRIRLTPEGYNYGDLTRLLSSQLRLGKNIFSLTYHSPSLAPGHTSYVHDSNELNTFFRTIRDILGYFRDQLGGQFMSVSSLHKSLQQQKISVAK
jgi:uncharacterized protein Usg